MPTKVISTSQQKLLQCMSEYTGQWAFLGPTIHIAKSLARLQLVDLLDHPYEVGKPSLTFTINAAGKKALVDANVYYQQRWNVQKKEWEIA